MFFCVFLDLDLNVAYIYADGNYIILQIDTLTTDIFILYKYDSLILDQGPTVPKYALSTNAFTVTFVHNILCI